MLNLPSSTYKITGKTKEGGYVIQGKKASVLEYHVALALQTLDIPFLYQYEFMGGRRLGIGGFIADFLAMTHPLSTPIWVHGEYWHRGRQMTIDDYQQAVAMFYHRGQINQPVVLWEEDVDTPEKALASVRRELRI